MSFARFTMPLILPSALTPTRKGKLKTVAVTAVARELSAFIWAINRQIANPGAAAR